MLLKLPRRRGRVQEKRWEHCSWYSRKTVLTLNVCLVQVCDFLQYCFRNLPDIAMLRKRVKLRNVLLMALWLFVIFTLFN